MRVAPRVVRTLLTAALSLVLAMTAAACGDGSTSAQPGPVSSAESEPAGDQTTASEGGYVLPDNWPIDTFPTPPGFRVSDDLGVTDTTVSLAIFDTDPQEMLAFFRETLPAEGYELVSEGGNEEGMAENPNAGFQDFTGNGITAGIIADDITIITLRVP